MLSKKEQIWRYILEAAVSKERVLHFEQKEIAAKMNISTSTVFNALKVPRQSGAVAVRGRGFEVRDIEKLLIIWATERKLKKDVVYETHVDDTIQHIESGLPGSITFGAYAAYKFRFHDTPADYDKVYVYAHDDTAVQEIKKRFPPKKGSVNLIVLEADGQLGSFGRDLPLSQLFVDLWNLPDWFAKDYLNALRRKMGFS
jgi:hypothetical protein